MASKRAKRRRRRQSISRIIDRQRGKRGGRTAATDIVLRGALRRGRIDLPLPGGGVRNVVRGAARTQIGRKALTVLRQRLSRVPGLGRAFRRTRTVKSARQIQLERRLSRPGSGGRAIAVRTAAPIAIGAGAGGVAFEAGRRIFDAIPQGVEVARRIAGGRRGSRGRTQQIPFTPGGIVPTDSITHTWVANGVPFAQLADGRVMVRRKNGTIKTFRRPRPIVLGRNPGVRDLVRADKKIDGLLKLVKKRFPARRTAAPRHSQQHN